MPAIPLTLRDRLALVGRAISGAFPTDRDTVGGRLLGGVIQAGGQPPPRGTREYLQAYSQMPWLRAVASRVSYDVAATEWELLVGREEGRAVRNRVVQRAAFPRRDLLIKQLKDDGEVEVITNHPSLDLLHKANAVQTGLMARRATQLHLDLVGEAFWLLERGPLGPPIAIWPIPPNWILGTPTPAYPFFRVSFRAWQGSIPASEFIWFSDVDPLNPYGRGTGTAQALADELETDEYASKHIKAFYFNRARPDLIIWPKGGDGTPMVESEVQRLEEGWTRHSGGFWRAFRPFFLRREVEIKELDQSFRSQQLVQLREFERNTILEVFGVSPETLGIITPGASRATITMGDAIYSRRVLIPRLELLRTVMQEMLLPLFDERLILHYVSPVQADAELELEAGKVAPYALSVDEWRARMGREPLEDGRGAVHMAPVGLEPTTFEEPALPPPIPLPPPGDEDGEIGEDEDEGADETLPEDEDGEPDQAAARRAIKACRQAGDADGAAQLRRLARKAADEDPVPTRVADRHVVAYRRAQEQAWHQLSLDAKQEQLAYAIRNNHPDDAADAFGGMAAVAQALATPLRTQGRPLFLRGAQLAIALLPRQSRGKIKAPIAVNLSDVNPEATRWAEREAAKLVTHVSADTIATLRALIVAANEDGIAPVDTARRIIADRLVGLLPRQAAAVERLRRTLTEAGDLGTDAIARRVSRYAAAQLRLRAMTIARTETIAAVNHGQQALWELARTRGILGDEAQRIWLVTDDDRLDQEICAPLEDETAGLTEPFPGGYMTPPAHPGCRCAIGLTFGKDGGE